MGGIAFRDDEGNVGFKWPKKWADEDLKGFFALNLTEGAISDKSKAGALAKALVVARVLWFLIQAIARKAQGLPIALLEVASLAFIAFNFAMYVFWWNKPLDVEFALEILGGLDGTDTLVEVGIFGVVRDISQGVFGVIPIGSWIYTPNRQWYPRLYSFGARSNNNMVKRGFIFKPTIAVTSSSFGAFHTFGWYLPASSQVERALWRVSCLTLTIFPLLPFFLSTLLDLASLITLASAFTCFPWVRRERSNPAQRLFVLYYIIALWLCVLCGIAYIGARLRILFLPFFELRHLPPLIHRTVSWSRFLSPI